MINSNSVKRYCCENISLIENYYKAIADTTQVWETHHRLETDKNLSGKELIAMDMYYHRPASELIFLTPFEHRSLHHKDKPKSEETKAKMRKPRSEVTKTKMRKPKPWNSYKRSEETRKKMSESIKEAWKRRKNMDNK